MYLVNNVLENQIWAVPLLKQHYNILHDLYFLFHSVTFDNGSTVEVWGGKSKGPPRKLKFPDKDDILAKIKLEVEDA